MKKGKNGLPRPYGLAISKREIKTNRNCERKNTPSKLRTRSVKQSIEQESDTEEGIAAALRPRNFEKRNKNKPKLRTQKYPLETANAKREAVHRARE